MSAPNNLDTAKGPSGRLRPSREDAQCSLSAGRTSLQFVSQGCDAFPRQEIAERDLSVVAIARNALTVGIRPSAREYEDYYLTIRVIIDAHQDKRDSHPTQNPRLSSAPCCCLLAHPPAISPRHPRIPCHHHRNRAMPVERTFSILKPDATSGNLTGAINAMIEKAGLRIVAQRRIRMTRRAGRDLLRGPSRAAVLWRARDSS